MGNAETSRSAISVDHAAAISEFYEGGSTAPKQKLLGRGWKNQKLLRKLGEASKAADAKKHKMLGCPNLCIKKNYPDFGEQKIASNFCWKLYIL